MNQFVPAVAQCHGKRLGWAPPLPSRASSGRVARRLPLWSSMSGMSIIASQTLSGPKGGQPPPTSAWPRLATGEALVHHVRSLRALPHEAVEHGCGERADIVIAALVDLGVPPWLIARGALMERVLSPAAMLETDAAARPHAITALNPLARLADLRDPRLEALLTSRYGVKRRGAALCAGPFRLDPSSRVQFLDARSHVFVVVRMWDARRGRPVDRVFDPALAPDTPLTLRDLRTLLDADDGWALRAPLGSDFRLHTPWLTPGQREQTVAGIPLARVDELDHAAHRHLFLRLSGAAHGSPGDPERWTYRNTLEPVAAHGARRRAETDRTGEARRREHALERALREGEDPTLAIDALRATARQRCQRRITRDATWSRRRLIPLVEAVSGMRYLDSLDRLHRSWGRWGRLLERDDAPVALSGVATRLRDRIFRLGEVSRDPEARIDARCFRPGHRHAVLDAIRQMNDAGMAVAVDAAGNLHGMWPADAATRELAEGSLDLSRALAFVSHLDTVHDAGLYDGRLGVGAGIEAVHVLHDLEHVCGTRIPKSDGVMLVVTAFANEEMTYAGQGVSMSGSAAVAGLAETSAIDAMTDGDDRIFAEGITGHLTAIRDAVERGQIRLCHSLTGDTLETLRDHCRPATDFFTPHTFERHIEQASALARADVPAALSTVIMGLYQADITIAGAGAPKAALRLVDELYALCRGSSRLAVGRLDTAAADRVRGAVLRCHLHGATDHAGAPSMDERSDTVAAAARLVRAADGWAQPRGIDIDVGRIAAHPGTNRNVIAGHAEVDLLVPSGDLRTKLAAWLEPKRFGDGEPVRLRLEPLEETDVVRSVSLSVDTRAEHEGELERLYEGIELAAESVDASVEVASVQRHGPTPLVRTGQALLLERSFGGSHNPHEHERFDDICAGMALQLAVLEDVMRGSLRQRSAYALAAHHMPDRWTRRCATLASAASHDTSNLALRAAREAAAVPLHAAQE